MKIKFISVLITNYNKGFNLKKSINSCVNQKFNKKEILVFDDCSTDNSLIILKKLKKIRLIINRFKKFHSGPLNQIYGLSKLLRYSKGNLIFLLDSDDFYKKNKIVKIHNYFLKNIKCNFLQDIPYDTYKKKKIELKKKNHFFSIWPSFYPTSSIVMRRDFFIKFLKYAKVNRFPNLEIDARLSIYAHLTNNFNVLNDSLTIYNYDNKGITSKYTKFSINWWKKRYEAFEYYKYLSKKLNIEFKKGPDYYLTNIISKFI